MKFNVSKKYHPAIKKAFSFYPELQGVDIEFREVKCNGGGNYCQPIFWNLIKKPRKYCIFIGVNGDKASDYKKLKTMSFEVQVGVLSHELGHVVDYESKSFWQLFCFVWGYVCLPWYFRKVERENDLRVIAHGAGTYLLAWSTHVHTEAEKQGDKFPEGYLRPEEIKNSLK